MSSQYLKPFKDDIFVEIDINKYTFSPIGATFL